MEGVGRVYQKLAMYVPTATFGEEASDVVAGLLLVAILLEKQRPSATKSDHRQAFLDLVGKLYDQIDIHKLKNEENDDAAV